MVAEIRLVVTDVDGTLVDRKQQIPARNLEAIRRFRLAGGLVTLGTGRIEASAARFLQAMEANAPAILYNGGRVVDIRTGRPLKAEELDPGVAVDLFLLLESDFTNLDPILYSNGRPYVRRLTPALLESGRKDSLTYEPVGSLHKLEGLPLSKALIIGAPAELERLEQALRTRRIGDGRAALVRSEATYLEVLPHGVSKGAALTWLAGHLALSMSHVLAVGDNLNDLEMIRAAGVGVAVANAHPDLKAVADFVSPYTNEEAAVADAIERFCLH